MVKFAHTLYKKMHLKEENYFGKNSPIALPKALCTVTCSLIKYGNSKIFREKANA